MRPATLYQRHFRRGTITVIVVAFLTLLAVVGLTFLIASQNYSVSSRTRREHENREDAPVPVEIINSVFGDIIYDAPDHDFNNGNSEAGTFNPVRGHGLARLVYGLNPYPGVGGGNTIPYAGIGRARGYTSSQLAAAYGVTDDYLLPNYTYFPTDNFVRDPERWAATPTLHARPNPTYNPLNSYPANPPAGIPLGLPAVGTDSTGAASMIYYPANANYTFPDQNNLALAVVDWSTGEVLLPSYHRPESFGTGAPATVVDKWRLAPPRSPSGALDPAGNPNWESGLGKYLILRPRPQEHPNFPYPKLNANGTYGDVENLLGKSIGQQYDSLWLDFNLPVKTWKGKQYKPLVALLVVDLDGRVNVNTAGNIRGFNNAHGANQNWGPHEVDLGAAIGNTTDAAQILVGNAMFPNVSGRYWDATFHNAYSTTNPMGPFGPQKRFTTHAIMNPMAPDYDLDTIADQSPAPGYGPHSYAKVDFDGAGRSATPARWAIPTAVPNIFQQFATWGPAPPAMPPGALDPNSRYWNGGRDASSGYSERILHPSLHNPYARVAKQSASGSSGRVFGLSEMAHLNRRYIESNQNIYYQTPLGQLAPNSIGAAGAAGAAVRNRITAISNDFDRPGATPWMTAANSPAPTLAAGQLAPTYGAPAIPFSPSGTVGYDTDSTYRALIGVLGAVDINRPLADYRTHFNQMYSEATVNAATAQRAVADRQRLAADIYARLAAAVGLTQINTYAPTPQGHAKRWYAQLAVNIVDYIDNDDYATPFRWTAADGGATGYPADDLTQQATVQQNYVFGTELPRLAINEVFIRYENDPNDPGLTMAMNRRAQNPYLAKVWVELHNPLTPTAQTDIGQLADQGNAKLVNNAGQSVYQILLVRPDGAGTPDASLRAPDNPDGRPVPAQVLTTSTFAGVTAPNNQVAPNIGAQYGPNASFYLVGSDAQFPDATRMGGSPQNANHVPTIGANTGLQYPIALFDPDMAAVAPANCPIVVLQRLLNPHLPQSNQNPFITVDYFVTQQAMVNDHLELTTAADRMMPRDWQNASAYGRRQPLQAQMLPAALAGYRQQPDQAVDGTALPAMNYANHTLGRHNGKARNGTINAMNDTLDSPFDWPVHLDRGVSSSAELTHVSAFKPHEFTQQFAKGPVPGAPFGHQANWFADTTRLYRALDLLHIPTRVHGLGSGGRVPGKVNINTLNDKAVFDAVTNRALANNTTNYYTQADIDTAWSNLNTFRYGTPTPPNAGTPWTTGTHKPYRGSQVPLVGPGGQYPAGSNGTHTSMSPFMYGAVLPPAINHPYKSTELLQNVMNNFTTRSNSFAVYATVGYFEVERTQAYTVQNPTGANVTYNRPVLGRELVSETGSVTRHRFFAIIDRTNLTVDNGQQSARPVHFSYEPVVPLTNNTYTPDPQPSGGAINVTVAIPATGYNGGVATGHYDGTDWQMIVGSQLILDYNPSAGFGFGVLTPTAQTIPDTMAGLNAQRNRTELVTVTGLVPDLGNGRVLVTFPINKQHARGTNILLYGVTAGSPKSVPGNPGPQRNFNYMDARYRPVIPHVEQVE